MARKIHFKNKEEAALWEQELLGQLSDGMFENALPRGHWRDWNSAKIFIDGKLGHDGGIFRREDYDFTPLLSNDTIRERMLGYINAVKNGKDVELSEYLAVSPYFKTMKENKRLNDYWKKKLELVKKEYGEDLDKARDLVLKPYGLSDLKKFLSEISTAMKTDLSKSQASLKVFSRLNFK